jgi:uncharacterized protein (DUF427 family)
MADDHQITISPAGRRVVVAWKGRVVADTAEALSLKEQGYPTVFYIPRKDVDMNFLERTDSHTTCPHKGVASYYSLAADGAIERDAVWTYETPLTGVASIKDHLAFYRNKVDISSG